MDKYKKTIFNEHPFRKDYMDEILSELKFLSNSEGLLSVDQVQDRIFDLLNDIGYQIKKEIEQDSNKDDWIECEYRPKDNE